MDYILQMEKLFKFLEFNLETDKLLVLNKLKRKFSNDLNLLGCFIKDYLIIKTSGFVPDDNEIYDEFIIFFEKQKDKNEIIDEILRYSKYYLMLVFEESDNEFCLNLICVINSCFSMEYFPSVIKLFDDYYYCKKIDGNTFLRVVKLLSDNVIQRFELENALPLSFLEIEQLINSIISKNLMEYERLIS